MGRSRLAVSMLFFVNGVLVASWVPYVPVVKSRLRIGDGVLGVTLLAMVAGGLLGLPLAGWLVGRFGSRRVAVGAASGLSFALPAPVLAPSVGTVALALFVFGVFNGVLDVSMNAQAVAVQHRCGRPVMSSFHALFSTGGLVGAAQAALAMRAGIPAAGHVIATTVVAMIAVVTTIPALVPSGERQRSAAPVFVRPSRGILGLGLLAFCALLAEGAMADWTAVYLRDVLTATSETAALGFAAFSLAMAAGRFMGDAAVMRWSAVVVVRTASLLAATGLELALVLGRPAAAIVAFGLVGLGIANIVPLVFSAAGQHGDVRAGTALAAVGTVGYFGWLVGPAIIGFLSEGLGLGWALGVVAAACVYVAIGAQSLSTKNDTRRVRSRRVVAHGWWQASSVPSGAQSVTGSGSHRPS